MSSKRLIWTPVLLAALATGCSGTGPTSESSDVTDVPDSEVKEQTIGNCWLYATAAWAESLHLAAGRAGGASGAAESGEAREIDLSEGYWSFWYWYEEITGGDLGLSAQWSLAEERQVTEGGWWGIAAELIVRYGWMKEGDFIPGADQTTRALRHDEAVQAINESLKTGALKDPLARRDKRLVLEELARVWGLEADLADEIARVFGPEGSRRLDGGADPEGSRVRRASELPVLSSDGKSTVSLADVVGRKAIGTKAADGLREGEEAWSEIQYGWGPDEAGLERRLAILRNMQDALHRRLALPIAWAVGEAQGGAYAGAQSSYSGLHESVIVDYQVENVPGYGTLEVGKPVHDPAVLEAALDPAAKVTLFRLKNSWGKDPFYSAEEWEQFGGGSAQPQTEKPSFLASKPGYNDLDIAYVDSDISQALTWRVDPHMMLAVALPNRLRFEVPPQVGPKRVFVTQDGHSGDSLFGLEGADAICQAAAKKVGASGTFKAYLSEAGEAPGARFDSEGKRYAAVQKSYGYSLTIPVHSFGAHPRIDEYGVANEGSVWSGLGGTDASYNCGGWSNGGTGTVAEAWNTSAPAGEPVSCLQKHQLLCIED